METERPRHLSRLSTLDWVIEGKIGTEDVYVPFVTAEALDFYLDECKWLSEKQLVTSWFNIYHNNEWVAAVELCATVH